MGNYDETPMNCGDCAFETHYENELFEHLKMHLRKDANITIDTESEEKVKKEEIEHSVEQRTIYEEDDCLHCGLCTFSSKSKKNMLRHSNIVHGVVINDKVAAQRKLIFLTYLFLARTTRAAQQSPSASLPTTARCVSLKARRARSSPSTASAPSTTSTAG